MLISVRLASVYVRFNILTTVLFNRSTIPSDCDMVVFGFSIYVALDTFLRRTDSHTAYPDLNI